MPYVIEIAEGGIEAIQTVAALIAGVNIARGKITNRSVAEAMSVEQSTLDEALSS